MWRGECGTHTTRSKTRLQRDNFKLAFFPGTIILPLKNFFNNPFVLRPFDILDCPHLCFYCQWRLTHASTWKERDFFSMLHARVHVSLQSPRCSDFCAWDPTRNDVNVTSRMNLSIREFYGTYEGREKLNLLVVPTETWKDVCNTKLIAKPILIPLRSQLYDRKLWHRGWGLRRQREKWRKMTREWDGVRKEWKVPIRELWQCRHRCLPPNETCKTPARVPRGWNKNLQERLRSLQPARAPLPINSITL